MQTLMRGSYLYMLMGGPGKKIQNSPDAKRFFESFRRMEVSKTGWEAIVNEEYGITANLPRDYQIRKQAVYSEELGDSLRMNVYAGADEQTGFTYLLRFNRFPVGRFIDADSAYAQIQIDAMAKYAAMETEYVRHFKWDDLSAYEFKLNSKEDLSLMGRFLMRTNTVYLAMATISKDAAEKEEVQNFFRSMHALPFRDVEWERYETEKISCSMEWPVEPEPDTSYGLLLYRAQHPNSGTTYHASQDTLDEYTTWEHPDSIIEVWRFMMKELGDTILEEKINNQPDKMWGEWVVGSSDNSTRCRYRLALEGRIQMALYCFVPAGQVHSPEVNHFFHSFRVGEGIEPWDPFADKTKLFFERVEKAGNVDLSEFTAALAGLELDSTHLPLVYAALERENAADTSEDGSLRSELIYELEAIEDETTLPFMAKLYREGKFYHGEDADLIAVMMGKMTKERTELMKKLVLERPSEKFNYAHSFILMWSMNDSLELVADLYPEFFQLEGKGGWEMFSYWMAESVAEAGLFPPEILENQKGRLIARFKELDEEIRNAGQESEELEYMESARQGVVDVLANTQPEEKVQRFLEGLAEHEDSLIQEYALAARFHLGLPVSNEVIAARTEKPQDRYFFYDMLEREDALDRFPKEYQNQASYAEMDFMRNSDDYYGVPELFEPYTSKVVTVKGEKGRLYLYRCWWPDDRIWYIGVSGLQPKKKSESKKFGDYTFMYLEKESDATQKEHIEKAIKEMETDSYYDY